MAGLCPSCQNVIFKQNLSGQARKKRGKKPNWMVLFKDKRNMNHFRLIWIKGTWIFCQNRKYSQFAVYRCTVHRCRVLDLLLANPIKGCWNINKNVNFFVLWSLNLVLFEHSKFIRNKTNNSTSVWKSELNFCQIILKYTFKTQNLELLLVLFGKIAPFLTLWIMIHVGQDMLKIPYPLQNVL